MTKQAEVVPRHENRVIYLAGYEISWKLKSDDLHGSIHTSRRIARRRTGQATRLETSWERNLSKIGERLLGTYRTWDGGAAETSILSSLVYAGPNVLVLAIVTILFFTAIDLRFVDRSITENIIFSQV